jgi:hypothetical protein
LTRHRQIPDDRTTVLRKVIDDPLIAATDQPDLFELGQVTADGPLVLARVGGKGLLAGVRSPAFRAGVIREPDQGGHQLRRHIGCVIQHPRNRLDTHAALPPSLRVIGSILADMRHDVRHESSHVARRLWWLTGFRTWHHDGMDDVRQELAQDGRAFGRARRAADAKREKLGETILRANSQGIGPAEIVKLINYELTERTVFRIIGDAKPES